ARAQPLLELGPYEYGAGDWQRRDPTLVPLPLDPRVMWTKMWQFSPPTRFGARYRAAVIGAPNVHLYTHANVCELEANESLRSIEGLRIRKLDWRLTALDRRSFRAFYEVMGRELGRSGAGRVQLLDWVTRDEDAWPGTLSGGWHHMGTTRMHANPRLGVVDANCRVHGLGNLYVAGAS